MIRQLTKCIREYKAPTVWTLVLILAEVAIDVIIPFETANLINEVKAGAELGGIVRVGLVLVLLAMISLVCGGAAGFTGSKAASGFAKNVRHDLFTKVQGFSFENIDKFSSASLVTRMTTDIQNVQMAYMMCIRIAVRAPLMMIFSIIMAFIMGGRLALTFVVIVPVLVVGLFFIAREAMPAFRAVFRKYDKLNESVEENVRAMRVVKGFARESYETKKFTAATSRTPSAWSRSTPRSCSCACTSIWCSCSSSARSSSSRTAARPSTSASSPPCSPTAFRCSCR